MPHEAPSTEMYIPTVLERTSCSKHNAERDEPCYYIDGLRGVCNRRAKSAGYNHPISDKARMNKPNSSRPKNRR